MRNSASTDDQDDLKQELDEDLSQVVHQYESKGLSPSEIVDSMIWHAELAVSNATEKQTVEAYVE